MYIYSITKVSVVNHVLNPLFGSVLEIINVSQCASKSTLMGHVL